MDSGISGLATQYMRSIGPHLRTATWSGSNRLWSTISSGRRGR
jgi:hypothetical protein